LLRRQFTSVAVATVIAWTAELKTIVSHAAVSHVFFVKFISHNVRLRLYVKNKKHRVGIAGAD